MIPRHGNDTVIGFIPGPDIDEGAGSHAGGLTKARDAFQVYAGWTGRPALGSYTYPAGGKSEVWDFARAQGAGPMSYRSYAIPRGFTVADVHKGLCDQVWTARATEMVAAGFGEGWFFPGYEGNGKNFPGSAGVVGVTEWAYAVSRQIRVMRAVPGWDNWIGINFTATNARRNGFDPVQAFGLITEPYQSSDLDLYPTDDFSGAWSASKDPVRTWAFMRECLEEQISIATRNGMPIGIGEWGPMVRTDGHATNGDPYTIAEFADWVDDHDVAHVFIYNGQNLPGDSCRFATYDLAANTYRTATGSENAAAAIRGLFDPATFTSRQQLDDVQAIHDLQQQLATVSGQLVAQTATNDQLRGQVAGLQAQLAGISSAVGPVLFDLATLGGHLKTLTAAIGTTPPTTGGTA